ncbi:hypothetical protein ACVW1C_004988 [Bradyrhizobium sp. USDA 4011]
MATAATCASSASRMPALPVRSARDRLLCTPCRITDCGAVSYHNFDALKPGSKPRSKIQFFRRLSLSNRTIGCTGVLWRPRENGSQPAISIIPLEQLRLIPRLIPPEVQSEPGSIPICAIVKSGMTSACPLREACYFIFVGECRASSCWYLCWYQQQSTIKLISNSSGYGSKRLPARGHHAENINQ